MASNDDEEGREPTREEIGRTVGPLLLEFGASWCGHCQALAPHLSELLESSPEVRHVKIEDGPGKIQEFIEHRLLRERQILETLGGGPLTIPEIVKVIYADVDTRLHRVAAMSVHSAVVPPTILGVFFVV